MTSKLGIVSDLKHSRIQEFLVDGQGLDENIRQRSSMLVEFEGLDQDAAFVTGQDFFEEGFGFFAFGALNLRSIEMTA